MILFLGWVPLFLSVASAPSMTTAREATKRVAAGETTERMAAATPKRTTTPMAIYAARTSATRRCTERPAKALGRTMIDSAARRKPARIAECPAACGIATVVGYNSISSS